MKKDVVICIGTVGSPTFNKCKRLIFKHYRNHPRVKKIVIIKNYSPQSSWLNEMRKNSLDSKWCLQVDEDMYLHKNALDILLELVEKTPKKKILNGSSLLRDLFFKSKVGSLKLWSTEAFEELSFNNVLGGDRDYAARASKRGYKNVAIDNVLGDHDSAPNPAVAFNKYFEYTQKVKKFSGDKKAKDFHSFLKRKYIKDKDLISKKAMDGSSHGLKKPINNKSKTTKPYNGTKSVQVFTTNNSTANFLIATTIWGREDVFRKFVSNNQKYGDILVIGSEGAKSRKLAEELGCFYVEKPNSPLGAKFNERIKWFNSHKIYSNIILLGSDNLISDEIYHKLSEHASEADLVSWKDIYFYDIIEDRFAYSSGYGARRKGEPYAPGRCLSRGLVKTLGHTLWSNGITSSPDRNLWEKLSKVKNQMVISCKDIGGVIIDIKSGENINSFDQISVLFDNVDISKKEKVKIKALLN